MPEQEIEALKQQFVAQLSPVRVYLFGSFADGSNTEDSDLDFYIVVADRTKDLAGLTIQECKAMVSPFVQFLLEQRKVRSEYILALAVLAVLPVGAIAGTGYAYAKIFTKPLGLLATPADIVYGGADPHGRLPLWNGKFGFFLAMQNILANIVGWFLKNRISAIGRECSEQ